MLSVHNIPTCRSKAWIKYYVENPSWASWEYIFKYKQIRQAYLKLEHSQLGPDGKVILQPGEIVPDSLYVTPEKKALDRSPRKSKNFSNNKHMPFLREANHLEALNIVCPCLCACCAKTGITHGFKTSKQTPNPKPKPITAAQLGGLSLHMQGGGHA